MDLKEIKENAVSFADGSELDYDSLFINPKLPAY
jgi:hypothetical protein